LADFYTIQRTLNSRLSTLPNLPKWARENLDLETEETEVYIRSTLIPGITKYPNIGENGFKVEFGIFEVQVKAIRQTGWGSYSNIVDDILDHFPRNLRLESDPDTGDESITIHILKSHALPGYFDKNGRYSIPVHIRYDTYILM